MLYLAVRVETVAAVNQAKGGATPGQERDNNKQTQRD